MSQLKEYKASFDLRWRADQHAIKRWQKKTGRKLVWPDHADLVVWLLGYVEKLESHVWIAFALGVLSGLLLYWLKRELH